MGYYHNNDFKRERHNIKNGCKYNIWIEATSWTVFVIRDYKEIKEFSCPKHWNALDLAKKYANDMIKNLENGKKYE